MDVDISDILASVTRAHDASTSGANGALASDSAQQQKDLQQLTRAWISERAAPELLSYPTDLMERTMRRIRLQIETIEDRTARMDAGTSFGLVVIQTELERFKFLVRSYLRARLSKIDTHALHILSLHQTTPANEESPLLSPQELQYLTTHAALIEQHYNASFLSSFPTKLQRLDDRAGAGGSGMVEGPDPDKAVFVRCLGVATDGGSGMRKGQPRYDFDEEDAQMEDRGDEYGAVDVSCGYTGRGTEGDMQGAGSTQTQGVRAGVERVVKMRRGQVWMVRWSAIRDAVRRGECELL